jgi:hypothetical protein
MALLAVLAAMFGAFLFGRTHAGGYGLVQDSFRKSRLVTDMHTQLIAAAEAEKRAVMAETDEASQAYATESGNASDAVEAARGQLGAMLVTGARSDEQEHFRAFSDCWTKLRDADREILELAVENTNLKAQRLSFAPAPAALARMQAALDAVVASAAIPQVSSAAYQAMTAALKIHGLEGRHIAEPRDAEMDSIEAEMRVLDEQVNAGLSTLSSVAGDAHRAALETARAAYADFQKIHSEVLTLSRRNTNVRSFALSLGQKRMIMAQCMDNLRALQEAVRPVSEATR